VAGDSGDSRGEAAEVSGEEEPAVPGKKFISA
jgi:hypothetical protein